jgi:hypothetical protein
MPRWSATPDDVQHIANMSEEVQSAMDAPFMRVVAILKNGRRVEGTMTPGPFENDGEGTYRGAITVESEAGEEEIDLLDLETVFAATKSN